MIAYELTINTYVNDGQKVVKRNPNDNKHFPAEWQPTFSKKESDGCKIEFKLPGLVSSLPEIRQS